MRTIGGIRTPPVSTSPVIHDLPLLHPAQKHGSMVQVPEIRMKADMQNGRVGQFTTEHFEDQPLAFGIK